MNANLQVRIQAAERAIQDATSQALKFANVDQTDTDIDIDDETRDIGMRMHETSINTNHMDMSLDNHSAENDISNSNSNNQGKMDDAAEFDLAMTLFGDDPRTIEEDLSSRLLKVENDLYDYFASKQQQEHEQEHGNTGGNGYSNSNGEGNGTNTGIDYESFGITISQEEASQNPNIQTKLLETEAAQLQIKINLLQTFSQARLELDQATSGTTSSSSSGHGRRRSGVSGGGVRGGVSGGMVTTATHLSRAKQIMQEAEESMKNMNTNTNTDIHMMSERDAGVAKKIMHSIQGQITRKTVDLHARAMALLDSCVEITPSHISICEGPADVPTSTAPGTASTSTSSIALNDSTNTSMSSTSTSSSNKFASQESTYEGLQVAMQVLSILSKGSGYSRLEDAVQVIVDQMLSKIVRPVISETKQVLVNIGVDVDVDADEKADDKNRTICKFQFEETTKKTNMGKMNSLGGSKVKALVSTLAWRRCEGTAGAGAGAGTGTGTDSASAPNVKDLDWWTELLAFIQKITKFVCDKILTQTNNDMNINEDLFAIFGKAVFGNAASKNPYSLPFDSDIMEHGDKCPMIKLLDRLLWEHCIPDGSDPTVLARLGDVHAVLSVSIGTFESFLLEYRLIKNSTKLQEYISQFDDKYNEKVRSSILVKGRKILLEVDYHDSVKVGVNVHEKKKVGRPAYLDHIDMDQNDLSLFLFEECRISQVASQLMDLCKATMELAVHPSTSTHALLGPTLYRSSRELLDLFRASIPAVHGSDIATIPRTASIFHNDCSFFAHKMLTFGLEYRDRFPKDLDGKESPLKQLCTFLDVVPLFRDLAERTMNDMIQFQKHQISEIVSPRLAYLSDALRSNEGVVEWSDAETAVTAGLYHLRHLSQAWKSMLAHDVYCITMGSIIDALFTLYLDKILRANDITVPSCHFVSQLFQNLLRGIAELSVSPTAININTKDDGVEKFCTLHHKFCAVGKFMDMSLADINMGLSEGMFRSVTGAELSKLVHAVFEDSEKRRKLLHLLESN